MKTTNKLFLSLILFLTIFNSFSCKKVDKISAIENVVESGHVIRNEEKFFNTHRTSDLTEDALVAYLKRINDKDKFVEKTSKQIGYPRWDKMISQSSKRNGENFQGEDSVHLYFIPFVRDAANAVNATMIIGTTSSDTSINYLCDWQYRDSITTGLSSRAQSLLLMRLDKNVFGKRMYQITDTLAFGKDDYHKNIKFVELSDDNNASANNLMVSVSITVCYSYWTPSDNGQLVGCPPGPTCTDYTFGYSCTTSNYWAYVEDGGGSPGGGGSGNPGNGGGGNPGDGGSTPPPCDVVPIGLMGRVVDPCDQGPGWIPIEPIEPIIYDEAWFNLQPDFKIDLTGLNDYPCVQAITNSVVGLNNSTIETIRNLFSETTKFNIKFEVDPNLGVGIDGKTKLYPFYNQIEGVYRDLVHLDITIKLNPAHLTTATKLSIAHTIIHEMIHAYFHYRSVDAFGNINKEQALANELGFLKPFDPNANPTTYGNQHEQMASAYISKIAATLKEYKLISSTDLTEIRVTYPNVTVDMYYEAMAWGGLDGSTNGDITKAWTTFQAANPALAQLYQIIISVEENATNLAATQENCH